MDEIPECGANEYGDKAGVGSHSTCGQVGFKELEQGRHCFDSGFADRGPFGFGRAPAAGETSREIDRASRALPRAVTGDALAEIVAPPVIGGMKSLDECFVMRHGCLAQEELGANLLLVEDELKLKTLLRADVQAVRFGEASASLGEGKTGLPSFRVGLFECLRERTEQSLRFVIGGLRGARFSRGFAGGVIFSQMRFEPVAPWASWTIKERPLHFLARRPSRAPAFRYATGFGNPPL